jgi:fluoride exporter
MTPALQRRMSGQAMWNYLFVAIGSALGGVARYGCGLATAAWLGDVFPWGTIFINLIGSWIIGFFATLTGSDARLIVRSEIRVFVMVGFCGGYTTFSSFSLQTFLLLRENEPFVAIANIVSSMLLCLLAVWLGDAAAASLNRPR